MEHALLCLHGANCNGQNLEGKRIASFEEPIPRIAPGNLHYSGVFHES